jgi:hypothetical protein
MFERSWPAVKLAALACRVLLITYTQLYIPLLWSLWSGSWLSLLESRPRINSFDLWTLKISKLGQKWLRLVSFGRVGLRITVVRLHVVDRFHVVHSFRCYRRSCSGVFGSQFTSPIEVVAARIWTAWEFFESRSLSCPCANPASVDEAPNKRLNRIGCCRRPLHISRAAHMCAQEL